MVDDAVDKACSLLSTSSKDLIYRIVGSSDTENVLSTNGASLKGSKARKRSSSWISWREVYQECSTLIAEAQVTRDCSKTDTNTLTDLKSVVTGQLPKHFIETA